MKDKKGRLFENIPAEVEWAKLVGLTFESGVTRQVVSLETAQKIRQIQKKYPEHFPWETKYDQIPAEVHEAYKREAFPELYKPLECTGGFGIDETIEPTPVKWDMTYDDFVKSVNEIYAEGYKRAKEKREAYKKAKSLWDKHYKKYGLEYRG